ncbi:MAG: AAA family ATPase [Promethearchaeia archaeon]
MSSKAKPIKICITGGKGGTGKTLCAVNIASMFKNDGFKTLLLDGDVENPNTYLLLGGELENKQEVPFFKPNIVEEKCEKCGKCAENCAPHALLYVKGKVPIPILNVCSGCKLCYKICPADAIEAQTKPIGWTYSTEARGISLRVGELKTGEARSVEVVDTLIEDLEKELKESPEKYDIIVYDTAPGAHCDVESLIGKADYVIPVTEPTKFGKLDLLRIIELIKLLKKDYKAIVNRSSLLGFKEQFMKELEEQDVSVLGDIPLDDEIVKSYCDGVPIMDEDGKYDQTSEGYKAFQEIFINLKEWINLNDIQTEGDN